MGKFRFAVISVVALVGCSLLAQSALAARSPVTGGVFTSVNLAVDGPGKCKNGNPQNNCNLYSGKPYVWLNGGPSSNGLRPDGKYFFAVLEPGGQPNPNDGGAKNLSDNYDTYQNRIFTITGGEVSAYPGTHDLDSGAGTGPRPSNRLAPLIRLYPFADTSNNGGVYIMAVCHLGATGVSYPVDPKNCKYDAFKAPSVDTTPPVCILTGKGLDSAGRVYIQITIQDPYGSADSGSGLENIVENQAVNATMTYNPDPWSVGTLSPVIVRATKVDATRSSFVKLTVTNVAGLSTVCDPEVPAIAPRIRRGGR